MAKPYASPLQMQMNQKKMREKRANNGRKVFLPRSFSWKTIFAVAFSFLMISSFLSPTKAEELITTPLEELLPPEDLPINPEYPWAYDFGSTINSTLEEPGFVEGRKATYYQKLFQVAEKVVYFFVYRFNDGESAKAYHDKHVDFLKSQGVYTAELSIPGAFALLYDYEEEQEAISLGYVSNIVFKIYYYIDFHWGFWVLWDSLRHAEGELRFFTNLQTSVIPEFPTFIIFPLFMTTTLFAVILYKRKHL